MSRPDDSLIARHAEQVAAAPPLFSEDVLEALTSAEARGEYTGERLFTQRPDIYRATVELLGQGVGVRQIARTLRVSHNTIAAVRRGEGDTVDTLKEQTVQALARVFATRLSTRQRLQNVRRKKRRCGCNLSGVSCDEAVVWSRHQGPDFGQKK